MLTTKVVLPRKIVSWNCLQWLEIRLTFVGVGESFHYKSFPPYIVFFRELVVANLSFQIFQLTEGFRV